MKTSQIFLPDIWVWSAQHSGRNTAFTFCIILVFACSCVEPALYPSPHTGLNQQDRGVSVNISAAAVKQCLSGQFLSEKWATRKKVGQELTWVSLLHTLSSNNNNNFPCPADEEMSVDIAHLVVWRLDHLHKEMAISQGGTQSKGLGGEMIQMGNRGKPGWGGMWSRLT